MLEYVYLLLISKNFSTPFHLPFWNVYEFVERNKRHGMGN